MTSTSPPVSRLVVADTGPLYALADPSDQYHLQARAQLDRLAADRWFVAVTYPTLAEAYTLVLRRLGKRYALQWLDQVVAGSVLLNPEPGDYTRAFDLIQSFPDQAITIFDAVAAAVCGRLHLPLWTFDRHFNLLGVMQWA